MNDNHYQVLGIDERRVSGSQLSATVLKQSYHRALLANHPDKFEEKKYKQQTSLYTVDQITTAYKVLSDPKTRQEYDRCLCLHRKQDDDDAGKEVFHTGLETVDLDDLIYDEAAAHWYRGCRCGEDRGYVLTEEDLEQEAARGEVLTGCKGCSLWLKVLFAAEPEK